MANYITTLEDKNQDGILPRTVLKAIADKNGNYLDEDLVKSDIDALKNGKVASMDAAITSLIKVGTASGTPDQYGGLVTDRKIADCVMVAAHYTDRTGWPIIITDDNSHTYWRIVGMGPSSYITGVLRIEYFYIDRN